MLKIFIKSAVRESGLKEDVTDRLWSEAKKCAETEAGEEEIFAEYRQELREDDDRD